MFIDITLKLNHKSFKLATSFLVVVASDFGLGGPCFAFVVLIVARDLLDCDPHVDRRLPFPP